MVSKVPSCLKQQSQPNFDVDELKLEGKHNGCFVAGTLVHTDKGLVPIQDIQVGDMVLSKPEDGTGEPEFKPVLKTFVHEDKEIWIVELAKNTAMIDAKGDILDYQLLENSKLYCSFLSTANHPVWVVGSMEHPNADIEFYEHPHWKRVDELRQYEIVVNHHGVMYTVERAQPTYQVKNDKIDANPNYYWYQKHYYEDYKQDYVQDAEDYMVDSEQEYKGIGYIYDIGFYQNNGRIGEYVKNSQNETTYFNQSNDKFVTTVYNFEVADSHTYFIGNAGIWVHNTDCENKTIEALTGKETVDVLLEYQDLLKEAVTGQVTKSPYMPQNNKTGFAKDIKEKFEKIMSDLLQYKKIADKKAYLKSKADLDKVRSESVVAVVDGNFKEKGVNYTGKKTTTEIDPVTGEEIKTIEKILKTSDGRANWQRIQQLYMGSFTQFTTASKNLWSTASGGRIIEFMLGGMNVIKGSGGGAFAKAIGDVLHTFKVTADGKITFSNMFTDIKAQYGAGYSDLVNYSIYNRYKKDFSELTDLQDAINKELAGLNKLSGEERKVKLAEINAMRTELEEKREFAFDFQKLQAKGDLEALEKIRKAEDEFLAYQSSKDTTKKVIKELAGTASLLEFHNGALSFSLAPSLRWLPSEASLADPIKLNAYNKTLADNARHMADALAEVANNKDFIKNMSDKEKQAFFEDQAGFDILKAGGSRWDPRTTGDWWSSHMYISIPKIETFTIPDKITGEPVTRNRFDSSGFYALEKKGDTYEVKFKTREEVLKELDPSKPSHQGLLKALKELENSSAQNQLVSTLPTSAYHPSMDTSQIQSVLEVLYQKSQTMITSLDTTLPLENQASQAVQRLNMLLAETQGQLTDAFLQEAFEKLLPQKSIAQFSQQAQDKGIIGDAIWQSVITAVSQYIEQDTVGCFVAGKYIITDNQDEPLVSIHNIKVGDKVLSKPENGVGETEYKLVNQVFIHHDKPIWLVEMIKMVKLEDQQGNMLDYKQYKSASREIEFLVTPNHPIWIIGILQDDAVVFYDQPQWKRVDELQRYEIAVNQHGVMYSVQRAQPVYQYQAAGQPAVNPDLYWYQKHYYEDYEQDYLQGDVKPDFDVTEEEYKSIGYVYDISKYELDGVGESYLDECTNHLKDEYNQYIPFTRTVYNLEVADYHTYFISGSGLWVHNTSSPSQVLLQTARDIANGITPISDHQLQSMYQVAKQYWLGAGATTEQMANIRLILGQLSDDALATTEGKLITLSPNAAGWGWFVDTTPNLNDEFTLGKNSYQANAGSEAEHKIDLLTVLIHEIGNVLGISHRTDGDVMTLRLAAGERRLPNQTDSQYLAWLQDSASNQVAQTGVQVLQAKAWTPPATRATLTNNNFTTQGDDWLTSGDIIFNKDKRTATLSETPHAQTIKTKISNQLSVLMAQT
ncbi:MAG: hypothetical protein Q4C68_05210 [Moraxella sp.]|nr:hypothetical protein [Moraxella sp.]